MIRSLAAGLVLIANAFTVGGCSSASRAPRRPTVAIVINAGIGHRPSSDEVARVHQALQPEIERRGYVLAQSSRSTDYFVHVRLPFDPLTASSLVLERAEPTVPFIRPHETAEERRQRENKAAISEMTREPR